MKLTEANDLSFDQHLKDAQSTADKVDVLNEFGKINNIGGADWEEFVNTNYVPLIRECEAYGLSLDNPFMVFLKKYGDIKVFLDGQNYDVLHNLVASNTMTTKQLAFTCPEKDQVRILLNPNLWKITPKEDVKWLIKTFIWFLEEDTLNDYIINAYVRAAFSDSIDILDKKGNPTGGKKIEVNFDTFDNRKKLLRNLYFTTNINELSDSKIKNKGVTISDELKAIQNKINAVSGDYFISHAFQPVDIIEQQIKTLAENVQESGRNENGQKQSTDTQKEQSQEGKAPTFNQSDAQFLQQNAQQIINAAGNQLNTKNVGLIKQALKYIGDLP